MATNFSVLGNNLQTTLAQPRAVGSGTVVVAAGYGATLAAAVAAAGFSAISPASPLRFTLVKKGAINSAGQITDPSRLTICEATGLEGDTLSGATVVEGTSDLDFVAGDVLAVFYTAGTVQAIQAAVHGLETQGRVTSVGLALPGGFTVGHSPVMDADTLTVTTSLEGVVKVAGGSFVAATADVDYTTPAAVVNYVGSQGFVTSVGSYHWTGANVFANLSAVVQGLATAPSSPDAGQIYTDTSGTAVLRFYNGSTWRTLGYGNGTVASVGISLPAELTVSGSPVTTTGTLAAVWASVPAYTILCRAASSGVPSFQTLAVEHIPGLPGSIITSETVGASYGGTGVNNGASTITVGGNITFSGTHTFTGTLTGNTTVTFPTSGTLATLSSPALTDTPTAPTAVAGTNTTQIATTAFVTAAKAGVSGGDLHFTFNQFSPSASWVIPHNLGKVPTPIVLDSSGRIVVGLVTRIDADTIQIDFSAAFSGTAYLN